MPAAERLPLLGDGEDAGDHAMAISWLEQGVKRKATPREELTNALLRAFSISDIPTHLTIGIQPK